MYGQSVDNFSNCDEFHFESIKGQTNKALR